MTRLCARCREELGDLDVLVVNAGTTHFIDRADLEAVSSEVWDDIFAVNVRGPFQTIRAAVPPLARALRRNLRDAGHSAMSQKTN